MMFTPKVRRWIYSLGAPVGALLVYYGAVESAAVPLWLAVLDLLCCNTLAAANVPRGEHE